MKYSVYAQNNTVWYVTYLTNKRINSILDRDSTRSKGILLKIWEETKSMVRLTKLNGLLKKIGVLLTSIAFIILKLLDVNLVSTKDLIQEQISLISVRL